MSGNGNLTAAKAARNDEFYTQYTDIAAELAHYRHHFAGTAVYCNCDSPATSNFVKYFVDRFEELGLRRLLATCWAPGGRGQYLDYTGTGAAALGQLAGDGDFRSPECVALLAEADIVVTNPPFSLFRDYVAKLVEHGKQFLIIGNMNAITYKQIFPLIRDGQMWLGRNKVKRFKTPACPEAANGYAVFGNIGWFTNLDTPKRHEPLTLSRSYNPEDYPRYDNYDAIEVSRAANIPCDYDCVMGVPISFMDKYCPEQFEIVDANTIRTNTDTPYKSHGLIKDKDGTINGKAVYVRIPIRRRHQQ